MLKEADLTKPRNFKCNDCFNSQHGCIKKVKRENACPGGIIENDLIEGTIPESLSGKCKGRLKIPWYKMLKKFKKVEKIA